MHKKDMGKMGEALVTAQLLGNECAVFTEYGDNSRIDLIVVDKAHKMHRVQVKTVSREKVSPNVSKLYLYKSGPNYSFTYTADMIDWFAVVDLATQKIAWVKSDILNEAASQISLRHDKCANGQQANVRYFDSYTQCPFN